MSEPSNLDRRVVIFGGGSDIGLAILAELARSYPVRATLAMRPDPTKRAAALEAARLAGVAADIVDFDATDFASHPELIAELFEDPVDVAILAFGQLADATVWQEQATLVDLVQTNLTGALSVGSLVAARMRQQGSGRLIVLSSMAGEKVRPSNFPYGITKAGMDEFFSQLADVVGPQVHVLIVRPGKVRTKMLNDAASQARQSDLLTVSPQQVARQVVNALNAGKQMIRVPWIFGPLVTCYRHLPSVIRRRLNF